MPEVFGPIFSTSAAVSAGVSQIIAGTGISISPVGGTGVVTINATGAGTGTVTSVSVVTANGFAGSVATPTTTPAITISTSVTGILKGNGTSVAAAVAGTDFPATGVIVAGGPTGSSSVVPVITWNANGQLTTVGTATITAGAIGALLASNNLSDVANAATSLSNLGGAPLVSPAFTGTPTAPTAAPGTNTTQIATTAFVAASQTLQNNQLAYYASITYQ